MERMFNEFADIWHTVAHHIDTEYIDGAKYWREALETRLGQGRLNLLELGVGRGNNLHHILYPGCDGDYSNERRCIGRHMQNATPRHFATVVDISSKMLESCLILNPAVECYVGDMRSVRLGRKFDAVLIHDAICYLLHEAEIAATLATAREHLRPGGVLIMMPDWFKETFSGPVIWIDTYPDKMPGFSFVQCEYDPDPADNSMEWLVIYFITETDGKVRIEQEHHTLGLFSQATWFRLMERAGFGELQALPIATRHTDWETSLLVGTLAASP